MTIKVHSENLILINNLTKTSDRLATAMGRLSTGYRINSASDGAAELMLSKGLEKQISGLSVCNDNANMAKSLLSVADGSLSQITQMAQRIRDIALSSANGIYSEDERRAYQSEVDALVSEIKRQTDEARYNDYKLFYGNTSPAIKTIAQGAQNAGTTGVIGTYKVQKVSQEEAEAQGYTCVSTAQELKNALVAGDPNCKVMLMADINLDDLGVDATGSNWLGINGFMGVFDGNGHTIKNLKINATADIQGFFRGVHSGSIIKNLNIDNAQISNTGKYTGALAGSNNGTIENCSVINSNIKGGGERTGGLVGDSTGVIKNCKAEINVEGATHTGGLIGLNFSEISSCSVSGTVTGNGMHVGGFAGANGSSAGVNGNIQNCYSKAYVTGNNAGTGGFVGLNYNAASITASSATGDVVGTMHKTGGFAGRALETSSISSCYSTGNVLGNYTTGGFIGESYDNASITSCYSTGNVKGEAYETGGFIGSKNNNATISYCYTTGDVEGMGDNTGGFAGLAQGSGSITFSYSTGKTKGNGDYTGGFAGEIKNSCSVDSCFATGNVIGQANTGGFAGQAYSGVNITKAYSTGDILGYGNNTGGFIGYFSGLSSVSNSYSTGEVTGVKNVGGFAGQAVGVNIKNVYSSGLAKGENSVGNFVGNTSGLTSFNNYSCLTGVTQNGMGKIETSGLFVPTGADDTAGKDANWFKNKNNLISILGEDWDYSYLNSNLTFQVGTNAGTNHILNIELNYGVDDLRIDVMSGDSSRESISAIDELIEYTTQVQGRIGSSMNALDSVLGNNTQTQINLVDSNSRLIDADVARESAEVVKTQIRQNMTASLLTQTGTNMSQIVLALYGL